MPEQADGKTSSPLAPSGGLLSGAMADMAAKASGAFVLTFAVQRRADLSRAAFHRYWFDVHGPLVAAHQALLGFDRYVQLQALEAADDVGAQLVRTDRGMPSDAEVDFDGVALLWSDALPVIRSEDQAAFAAVRDLIVADERKFIDHARSQVWFSRQRVVVA